MTCGQSTAPRLSRFDHEPRPKPVSCNEDLPASLADVSALDSRRNLKPGRQKSLQVPRGHLLGCSGGRSSRTAHPSGRATEFSEAGLVCTIPGVEHLLSVALDTTSRSILADGRSVASSFLSARGLVSTHLSGGRHSRVSILDSLAGSGRIYLALVWLCGHKLAECSGVDTTRRPGGSPALPSIRATHSPTYRTFDPRLATASMVSR
jgi:hypothetical protein